MTIEMEQDAPTTPIGSSEGLANASLRDQAELLLSIAGIAQSEITTHPTALLEDTDMPSFPCFSEMAKHKQLSPRLGSLRTLLSSHADHRVRTVSIDGTFQDNGTRISPLNAPPTLPICKSAVVTPTTKPKPTARTARLSIKPRRKYLYEINNQSVRVKSVLPEEASNLKPLQEEPPKGVPITKIMRRKFSWKNYPELEQFLVANRQEYLRHSALNYTLQQKQYNNRLTQELLDLATENGYIFDETDFGFVTVRDRIRCYYKSFVQSAKKKGILMGYAARKAGLLDDEELEKCTGLEANIIR